MSDLESHPALAVEAAVTAGDRRRRAMAALNATTAATPIAAVVMAAGAVLTRLVSVPTSGFVLITTAAVVYLALVAARAAWPMRDSDPVAARLDRDAALDGALRSAHWFATAPASDEWTAFHVATAAERARTVDWYAVYAPAPARRPLATAATIVAVSVVVLLWPAGPARLAALGDARAQSTAPAGAAAKLAEVLEALVAADISAEDARELLKDLLRNPDLDPNVRKQIQSMTGNQGNQQDEASQAPNQGGEPGDKSQQASGEGQPQGAPQDSDDLEWALNETASKMANEDAHKGGVPQSDEEGESKSPSESSDPDKVKQPTTATAKESAEDRERKTSGGAGLSLDAESAEQNAGGERGEGLSSSGAGDTDSSRGLADARETSEALAREIIRAIDSPEGKNIQVEEARRTESRRSSVGFSGIDGLSAYDRSKADTSAIVPEARRPLLERYFVREAK